MGVISNISLKRVLHNNSNIESNCMTQYCMSVCFILWIFLFSKQIFLCKSRFLFSVHNTKFGSDTEKLNISS